MIQAIIAVVVVATIAGVGFANGKKWEKSVWQPVYHKLADQMKTMQHELNLKAETATGKANTLGAELTVIGKVSEVDSEYMDKEVNRRVERYLNDLSNAGLQPVPKEGDSSNQSSSTSTLSFSARASFERSGASGLFANLDRLERRTLQRIIKKAMESQTEAIKRQKYLKQQEAKMDALR